MVIINIHYHFELSFMGLQIRCLLPNSRTAQLRPHKILLYFKSNGLPLSKIHYRSLGQASGGISLTYTFLYFEKLFPFNKWSSGIIRETS